MFISTGPIVSALINRFGCRPVVIAGSITAATAFVLATLSPNIDVLTVTYGFMGGQCHGNVCTLNLNLLITMVFRKHT